YKRKLDAWKAQVKPIQDQIDALTAAGREKLKKSRFMAFNPDVQESVRKPVSELTPLERWMHHRAQPFITLSDEAEEALVKKDDKARYEKLKAERDAYSSLYPGDLP